MPIEAGLSFSQIIFLGDWPSQIITLADNLEIILHRVSVDFLRGASLLVVSFIASYFVNVLFFYVLFFWFIAFATFSISMSARLVQLSDDHASSESQLSGQLIDSLSNQSNIHIFSRKIYEAELRF
ncbi:multidrug resistance ABC transporter ATP binding protein [Legionella tucsonensis]|uniref:Multidrug resistance ABC transporter ATP binding protein n=1 Tax=Legionella tucsonensis TaxID=40335 RepID=A0A0W0ZWH2_9GAMM|nr:multidrug resistance ABC transporter ATP binding protein [Legionella tucsonensis]